MRVWKLRILQPGRARSVRLRGCPRRPASPSRQGPCSRRRGARSVASRQPRHRPGRGASSSGRGWQRPRRLSGHIRRASCAGARPRALGATGRSQICLRVRVCELARIGPSRWEPDTRGRLEPAHLLGRWCVGARDHAGARSPCAEFLAQHRALTERRMREYERRRERERPYRERPVPAGMTEHAPSAFAEALEAARMMGGH
jgi:hypothetical protein